MKTKKIVQQLLYFIYISFTNPVVVDPAHPFPFISNLSLNLAALIKDVDDSKNQFVDNTNKKYKSFHTNSS